MASDRIALLFALLSPIFSGVATAFQGDSVRQLGPLRVAAFGSLLAGGFLCICLSVSGRLPTRQQIWKFRKELLALVVLRNILAIVLIACAFRYTSSIHVMFFTKVEAYYVLLWYWLFQGGVVFRRHIFLLGIHLCGAWLLSTGGVAELGAQQAGDLLIIAAMGLTSLGYPFAAKLSHAPGGIVTNAITMLVGGVVLLPVALLYEAPPVWTATAFTSLIIYTMLFNVLSITLWFFALKSVVTWIVSGLRAVSPIAGAPVAYWLFGESLSSWQWYGAIIVLVTSSLMAREHLREKIAPRVFAEAQESTSSDFDRESRIEDTAFEK